MTEVAFYTFTGGLEDRGNVQGEIGMRANKSGVAELVLVDDFPGRIPEQYQVEVTRIPLNPSFKEKITEISFVDEKGEKEYSFSRIVRVGDKGVAGEFFRSGVGWMDISELDLRIKR